MGTEVLSNDNDNDNDNIKFSYRPKEFWLTLISTIAALVLSLFSWVKVDLQSGYIGFRSIYHTDLSFNLFNLWGKLNVFDDMIALSSVTDAIKAMSMILSILMFVSLTLLIISLIRFRSKRRAIFAYCGFGLMALVSLAFIEMPHIYNTHMVMTAFPFLTIVVSIIGILFNDKPDKTNNGLLRRVIFRIKENPEILFACIPFVLQFVFVYWKTSLYIPALKLYLGSEAFPVIVYLFGGTWVALFLFRESVRETFQRPLHSFVYFIIPVEITTTLIWSQHYFDLVLGLMCACLIGTILYYRIKCDKLLPGQTSASNRRRIFCRGLVTVSAAVLTVSMTGGSIAWFSNKPLAESRLIPQNKAELLEERLSTETFLAFSAHDDSIWRQSSDGLKMDDLQTILDCETVKLGIEPLKIDSIKLGGGKRGSFEHGSENKYGRIHIDYVHMLNDSAEECIETLCHQAYHAYQWSLLNKSGFKEDVVTTTPYFSEELAGILHSTGELESCDPSVERYARKYAKQQSTYYMEQIESGKL